MTHGGNTLKILGLDSSGLVAGVAIVEDNILLAEYTTNYKKTHSQTLLPMLAELREMIDLDMESIDAIAIASGPGSFTGLRIGAATAKGLGHIIRCGGENVKPPPKNAQKIHPTLFVGWIRLDMFIHLAGR